MAGQTRPLTQKTGKDQMVGAFVTAILLAGLWWVLTNGSAASWLLGLPALAGATWASRRLNGSVGVKISPVGLIRFVPFFLWESLRGGTDVALRTLTPHMRIQPGFSRYRTRLHTLPARTFFAYCVSLLPGTLTADLQDDWLEIHILDIKPDPHIELVRLERSIAQLFAQTGDVQ